MNAVPPEVNSLIIKHLDDKTDLANSRQVSKALAGPATERLFSNYHIVLPAIEDDPSILANLNHILSNKNLAKAVRTLRYTTSLDPNKRFDDYHNDEELSDFDDIPTEAISVIASSPNLTNLELEFSAACAVDNGNHWGYTPEEDVQFRFELLDVIFRTLNVPSSKLTSLSIKNLQNHNDPDLTMSENFLAVLGRLSELRLKIITEEDTASPESAWNIQEMHTFMEDLPATWLEPARENLTSLTLHMDTFWGYYPKCELRGIKFPKLKKLELGNYTFAHDWQLEWILSHAETLEELVLDYCPIVKRMRNFGAVNAENFPIWPTVGHELSLRTYEGRWADYFKRIEEGLPKLKTLRFGAGMWDNGENFDGGEWSNVGIHRDVYTGFDKGIGPSPWMGDHNDAYEDEDEEDDTGEGSISITESVKKSGKEQELEDWEAYDNLMAVLAMR
jgi:hypothetical protein